MHTKDFYNLITPYYSIIDLFLKPNKKQLITILNSLSKGKLLEIGAGSDHIHSYNKHYIDVIDISEKMLNRRSKNHRNIKYKLMDASKTIYNNNTFDYIVMSHVISTVDDPNELINEAHRILKPKGQLFILNHFTPNNLLQYCDLFFSKIATLFHFKSYFKYDTLTSSRHFLTKQEFSIGIFNYNKLIILKKG